MGIVSGETKEQNSKFESAKLESETRKRNCYIHPSNFRL